MKTPLYVETIVAPTWVTPVLPPEALQICRRQSTFQAHTPVPDGFPSLTAAALDPVPVLPL